MGDFPRALSLVSGADVRGPVDPFGRLPDELMLKMLVLLDPSCRKLLKLREVYPRWRNIIETNIEFLYRNLRSAHPELLLPKIEWKGTPHERFMQFLYECTLAEKLLSLKSKVYEVGVYRARLSHLTDAAKYDYIPGVFPAFLYYLRNGVDRATALRYAKAIRENLFYQHPGERASYFPEEFDSTRYATRFPLAALQKANHMGGVGYYDQWKDRLLARGPGATDDDEPREWPPDPPDARDAAEPTAEQLLAETAAHFGVSLEFPVKD